MPYFGALPDSALVSKSTTRWCFLKSNSITCLQGASKYHFLPHGDSLIQIWPEQRHIFAIVQSHEKLTKA